VAQAVSKYRMKLTGIAQSTNESPGRPISVNDYSRAEIDRHLASVENGNCRLRGFCAALGFEVSTFFYEDICASPLNFVNGIFAHIGFEPRTTLNTRTDIQKIGDEINEEWIKRYRNGD